MLWEENAWRPALAIGLQDMIGTGIYQGEYIAASKRFWAVDATIGLGWYFLGEPMKPVQAFGALLILSGITLSAFTPPLEQRRR